MSLCNSLAPYVGVFEQVNEMFCITLHTSPQVCNYCMVLFVFFLLFPCIVFTGYSIFFFKCLNLRSILNCKKNVHPLGLQHFNIN